MSLEQKIKDLLEGKNQTAETLSEEELIQTEDTEVETEDEAEEVAVETEAAEAEVVEESVDHIAALVAGEDLSEEFKQKAATIFEAAIADGVKQKMSQLDEAYAVRLSEAVEAVQSELVENIDGFLNEAVETWMKDNELALERGIKGEIVENFIDGLKTLFNENYIEVPDDKLNVLDEQASEIESLTTELTEAKAAAAELETKVVELSRVRVMESVGDVLTDLEYEKFAGLCENVSYVSDEDFESKVKTIKETYFPKTKRDTVISESDSPIQAESLVEGVMSHYVSALANPLSFKR